MIHLPHPWPGTAAITQRFGISTYEGEPPGFLWPDGSVSYFTVGEGTVRHDHVHSGIDVGLTEGTPLVAPSGGVVEIPPFDPKGYGNCIKIVHASLGLGTLYGHLSEIDVKTGDVVAQNHPIGKSGNTGNSNGPHLHFSVYRLSDRHYIDPLPYLNGLAPAPEPATIPTTVHLAQFTVVTADGTTRVWDGPSTKLRQIGAFPSGKRVACDAWMRGEARLDKSTGRHDPLWFHLADNPGWVPSAHTIGYPPGINP